MLRISLIILLFLNLTLSLKSNQIADSLSNLIDDAKNDSTKILLLHEKSLLIFYSDKYEALKITDEAIKIARNISHKQLSVISIIEKARHYRRMHREDSAMQLNNQAVQLSKKNNLYKEISLSTIEKGRTFSAQKKYDSALVYFENNLKFSRKSNYTYGEAHSLLYLGKLLQRSNLDSSLTFLKAAIYSFNALDDKKELVKACNAYATTYAYKGDLGNALFNFQDALEINLIIRDYNGVGNSYSNIALVFQYQSQTDSSIIYHIKALENYELINNKQGIADQQSDIGILYRQQKQLELALKYFKMAVKNNEENDYKPGLANSLNNTAITYEELKDYSEAKKYYQQSLEINLELEIEEEVANLYSNLCVLYYREKDFKKAEKNYKKAVAINLKSKERELNLAINYNNLGDLYYSKNDNYKAMRYYLKAKALSEKLKRMDLIQHTLLNMSNVYSKLGEYQNAYRFYKDYSAIKDSIFNAERLRIMEDMSSKYQKEQQEETQFFLEQKQELLENKIELEQENNQIITYTGITAVIILSGIIIFIFILFRNKKRISEVLATQKEEILIQKSLVDAKNEEIYSSIRYAQKIQNTIIPQKGVLDKYLGNYFIYYKPKDIVSGDFYWFEQTSDYTFLVAADCTGHGIPGSMLSIIGNKVLNNAIKHEKLTKPNEILENINSQFLIELNQKSGDAHSRDGMDVCLIKIDRKNNRIDFAGAKRPLIYILDGEINVIKGDKYSIGGNQKKTDISFTCKELDIKSGLKVFLTTDGYVDQMGESGKKFGSKKLRDILMQTNSNDMSAYHTVLDDEFNKHIGQQEQRDDITMIGIEFD